MKIAFLILEIYPGAGQTNNLKEIIKSLHHTDENIDFTVFTHVIGGENIFPAYVTIKYVKRYYSYLIYAGKLSEELAKFDAIYVKGAYPYVTPALKSKKPTVLVVHQMDSPKLFKGLIPKVKIISTNAMTRSILKKPARVVTISDELGEFYARKYRIDPVVIEDQISESYYSGKVRTIPREGGKIVLLSVGSWDGLNGRKRQHVLIDLVSKIHPLFGSLELRFTGLRDDQIVKLRGIAEHFGIGEIVKFRGVLTEEELREEYLNGTVYVTATTYEGFYRQVVEAFASGMPALVYDARELIPEASSCAAVNHIIKSNAGELFTDASSFSKGLKSILDNYSEYSKNAIQYAKKYSSDAIGKKTYHLLSQLIGKTEPKE